MAVDVKKLAYWTEHHHAWEVSGVTQRVYCQREGLSFATFDYWRRLARDQGNCLGQEATLTLVPVRVASGAGHHTDVSAVSALPLPALQSITLRSPGGWQISFSTAEELAALLPLLQQLP